MIAADTAWMLASTALVLLMTPALGFFYGGLVREKNSLNTIMMSVAALGFVGIAWALIGYSLAFAPGSGFLGGMSFALLRGVGLDAQGTIPHLLFMSYQATFAIITAALISGAIVEDKANCIAATNAQTVICNDAGCTMNISGMLHRRNQDVKVKHIAEILAEAMGLDLTKW